MANEYLNKATDSTGSVIYTASEKDVDGKPTTRVHFEQPQPVQLSGSIVTDVNPIPFKLISSKTEVNAYYKDNMLEYTSLSNWEIRDSATKSYTIPHASEGIYETTMVISSTLDQPVTIKLYPYNPRGSQANDMSAKIFEGVLPANDGVIVLAPERGMYVNDTSLQKNFEVRELRLPFNRFSLRIEMTTAPTTGEFFLTLMQRY